MKSDEMKYI